MTKARGQLLAQERDIERLRAEGHTANCQLRQDLDSGFRNELEKMKDNELASITHQLRELESGKNRRSDSVNCDNTTGVRTRNSEAV